MQINHVSSATEKCKAELKYNTMLSNLEGKTPAEIGTWVDNNINDVSDVKTFIKFTLMVIQALELNK